MDYEHVKKQLGYGIQTESKDNAIKALEQLQAKVADLEEENERLNGQISVYRLSFVELERQRDVEMTSATRWATGYHELRDQLAAAQEDNQKLRIALDSTKRDLIRMRCPDFFEGVRDGYEFSFDNHLVNMIGLINDYTKQE